MKTIIRVCSSEAGKLENSVSQLASSILYFQHNISDFDFQKVDRWMPQHTQKCFQVIIFECNSNPQYLLAAFTKLDILNVVKRQ